MPSFRNGGNVGAVEYRWDEGKAGAIESEVDLLAYLSNLIGQDPTLTQPGGGNSSLKGEEADFAGRKVAVLRVKGSGTDLASIGRAGFTGLRLEELALLRKQKRLSDEELVAFLRATMLDGSEPAPSIETPLHAMLPFRFIVHTHDFATQALTDTNNPEALVREAFGAEVAYIGYFRPGFPLARAVMDLGAFDPAVRGLVLGRHGLVAWGDTAKGCYDNLHRLIGLAERRVARDRGANPRAFGEVTVAAVEPTERRRAAVAVLPKLRAALSRDRPVVLHYDDSPEALAFAGARDTPSLVRRGMATPEHILRCGRVPLHVNADLAALAPVEAERAIDEAMNRFRAESAAVFATHGGAESGPMLDPVPRVVVLPGLGLVTAMKDKANAVVGNLCYRHVMRVMEAAEGLGGFEFIGEKDALEIEYWPLERAKLNQPERELSRRVALVTGAASGIGRAIAERFAREGAHLVLTDIDGKALREATAHIAATCKDPHRVVAVEADARTAADAAASVSQAVLAFGGLDILVCNAGFLQAGPIDEVSDETWDAPLRRQREGLFPDRARSGQGDEGPAPRRHRLQRVEGRIRPHRGQCALRQLEGGGGRPGAQPGHGARSLRHPGQLLQCRFHRHAADAAPRRAAGRPQGRIGGRADRGVPGPQRIGRRPHSRGRRGRGGTVSRVAPFGLHHGHGHHHRRRNKGSHAPVRIRTPGLEEPQGETTGRFGRPRGATYI